MHKNIKYIICLILSVFCGSVWAQTTTTTLDDERKFDHYFYEAVNAKVQGNLDEAFDLLNYCLAIDSTKANVYYELGNFHNMLDNKNKALDYFRKAKELDSDNFYYALTYATICLEFKQYADAIELYEELIKVSPENTDVYIYLAESYRLDGDTPKAISTLNRLEQIIGLNEKVSLQKYQLYKSINQESKGFTEIQKFIDKYPTETKYQILLGNLYMQSDKLQEAFAIYSRAKEVSPEDPYIISSMAEYYEKTGNKEAAEKELQIALVSPKMDVDTKLSILAQYVGTLYQNKKDTKVVNALFDTLIVQHPQEPKLNMMYGNLLMLQERKEEARFQFQIFAESNPTDPSGWEQMLSTTFPDSLKLTMEICKTAIAYVPEQPQFYFYLGIGQYMEEQYEEALASFQNGMQYVDSRNGRLLSDFHGQIGDLYYRLGENEKAYEEYNKALSLESSNLGVLNNYSYYLSLEKKELDKAEKMSSATVKAEPTNPTYLDTYGWVLFQQGAYIMSKIYIENAIRYTGEQKEELSSEVLEHYGDVLFKTGEEEKALEYWIKAKEMSATETKKEARKSKTLEQKIQTKTYIPE